MGRSLRQLTLFLGLVVMACATAQMPGPPELVPGGVRFTVLIPAARSVAVAGDFNGWSTVAHSMTRVTEDGLWAIVIPLPKGEHAFSYVVNGTKWLTPPMAQDFVPDGFGMLNGVVVVP